MRRVFLWLCVAWWPVSSVWADSIYALRNLRPGEAISAQDVALRGPAVPGAMSALEQVVGLEARVAIYAGRPVMRGETGPPPLVRRNQLVMLRYSDGGLDIRVEGRAMGQGAAGERVRVVNMMSRNTVSGVVSEDGEVIVTP